MRARLFWLIFWTLVLFIWLAKAVPAAIYPVGGEKDHSGFVITLGLGGSWYSQSRGKWLRGHLGEDFVSVDGQTKGVPVRAMTNGNVVFADNGGSGWGPVVIVKHGEGNNATYFQYAHLQNVQIHGGYIKEGDLIGEIGQLPEWSPHLHLEIKTQEAINREGQVGRGYSGQDGYAPDRLSSSDLMGKPEYEPSPCESEEFNVCSSIPKDGSENVDSTSALVFTFNQPVNLDSLQFDCRPSPIVPIHFYGMPSDSKTVTVAGQLWAPNKTYTVTVLTETLNQNGQKLTNPYRFSFTTGPWPNQPAISQQQPYLQEIATQVGSSEEFWSSPRGIRVYNPGPTWVHVSQKSFDPAPSRKNRFKAPVAIKTFVIFRNNSQTENFSSSPIHYYIWIYPRRVPKQRFFPATEAEINVNPTNGWQTAWIEVLLFFRKEDRGEYLVKIQPYDQLGKYTTYTFTVE